MHGLHGRDIMFSNAGVHRRNKVSQLVWLLAICTLVLVNFSASIPLEDFYPFDISGADNKTKVEDDGGSEKIFLSVDFPFFNYTYNSLYVNNNGIISFVDLLKSYKPLNFNDSRFKEKIPVIAPFWADVDIEHVTDLNETVVYRVTDDKLVLAKASSDIQKHFTGQADFSAKLVLIVTWYNVGYYGAMSDGKQKRNTFQSVLVTNGARSFAIFNYNQIVWTTGANSGGIADTGLSSPEGSPAVVGFSAGDLEQYYLVEYSGTPEIINITQRSNVGIPGKYIFRLDGTLDDHSCFLREKIEITPSTVSMLGHEVIRVTGPCLIPGSKISGRIKELNQTFSCDVAADASAVCVPPSVFRTGELTFELDPYRTGWEYSATLTSVNVLDSKAKLSRRDLDSWYLGNLVEVAWDSSTAPSHQDKFLDVVAYRVSPGGPELHVVKRVNVSQGVATFRKFRLPTDVELNGLNNTLVTRLCWQDVNLPDILPICLWSDVFPVRWSSSQKSQQWCETWLDNEKLLPRIKVRAPYCPCIMSIAENDLGNFQKDPSCDSDKTSVNTNCLNHPSAQKCFSRNSKSATDNGETCCYNSADQLMDIREYAGSGTHQRYHFRAQGDTGLPSDSAVPFFSYFEADVLPRLHCCQFSEDRCKEFIQYRNATTCQQYSPPSPALAAGDPHLVTLDGKNYTFNGVGDFYLVTDVNNSIVIQVRAEQAIDQKGTLQNATVFTGLAVKVPSYSDTIEIRKQGQTAQVLVNKLPYTTTNATTSAFRNISLHNDDGNYLVVLEPVSVSITVEVTPDLLNIIALIGEDSFKGKLRGLLGNYNGDPTDDFISRDGSSVSSDASMRDIHNDFGMTWAVPENESIFSSNSVSFDEVTQFQPVFIDEQSKENLQNDTYELCGTNIRCIYDYQITQNKAVAQSTAKFTDKFEAIKQQLEQKVVRCPYLSAPENGNMTKTGESEGDVATFTCNEGFEMVSGNPTRVCQNDNTWSGADAVCAKKIDSGSGTSGNIIILAVVATSSVVGVALIVVVIAVVVWRIKHQSKPTEPDPIPLTGIGHIPVFEDPAFRRRLQETVGDGPYRIPRPKYVDPSIFTEFF